MRITKVREWTQDWHVLFMVEAQLLQDIFQEQLIQIYHIGSTSIRTIGYAKPIIDIAIGVRDLVEVDRLNEKMAALGYAACGENGIKDRRFFTKGGNNRTHHVHIYAAGHANINLHLRFIYYLKHHKAEALQYGLLKKQLATKFRFDVSGYQDAKQGFVNELLDRAVQWPIIEKAYGYVTRKKNGKLQILVFHHPVKEAGIQIPKGTVEQGELPIDGVQREMAEETGLTNFQSIRFLIDDYWVNDDGHIHHRYFYQLQVDEERDNWDFEPIGGGEEEGKAFYYYWIGVNERSDLIRGHADYFRLIVDEG